MTFSHSLVVKCYISTRSHCYVLYVKHQWRLVILTNSAAVLKSNMSEQRQHARERRVWLLGLPPHSSFPQVKTVLAVMSDTENSAQPVCVKQSRGPHPVTPPLMSLSPAMTSCPSRSVSEAESSPPDAADLLTLSLLHHFSLMPVLWYWVSYVVEPSSFLTVFNVKILDFVVCLTSCSMHHNLLHLWQPLTLMLPNKPLLY